MATPPASPPPQPQPTTVLAWLQQLPPWLPPVLWLAGGGTIGAGGLGMMEHQQPAQVDDCAEEQEQLDAVTAQLVNYLSTCECDRTEP